MAGDTGITRRPRTASPTAALRAALGRCQTMPKSQANPACDSFSTSRAGAPPDGRPKASSVELLKSHQGVVCNPWFRTQADLHGLSRKGSWAPAGGLCHALTSPLLPARPPSSRPGRPPALSPGLRDATAPTGPCFPVKRSLLLRRL